ncbi:MAG: hypothetical protein WAL30_01500 [Candidatus Aquirickettsiella sp.]
MTIYPLQNLLRLNSLSENTYLQLAKIKLDFPILWQKLESQKNLIDLFITELNKTSFYNHKNVAKKIQLLFTLNLTNLVDDESINSLVTLIKKNSGAFNVLMSLAQYQPEALKFVFDFIQNNPLRFDKNTVQQLFLKTNNNGCNSLMLAAQYQPEAVESILNFIQNNLSRFDHDTRQKILLTNSKGCNAFMFATRHQPTAVKFILGFIKDNLTCFDPTVLQKIFLRTNTSGYNSLGLAARYHTEMLKPLHDFILEYSQPWDKKILKVFLQDNMDWDSALKLLEKYLADLSGREEKNITHTTKFFGCNFGYSTEQKKDAALALKTALVQSSSDLLSLKKQFPALRNRRLGLITTFFELNPKTLDLIETNSINQLSHDNC